MIDLTSQAPASYRMRKRKASEITTIVLHSTGFAWDPDNKLWVKVRAHYTVRRDGSVLKLHDPLVRMRVGSGVMNRVAITIEHEGNPRNTNGVAWHEDTLGAHSPTPAMIESSRALLTELCAAYPSIRYVTAHRKISRGKPNCPGPEIWHEVGEWALGSLGLSEAPTLSAGLDIPVAWRLGMVGAA